MDDEWLESGQRVVHVSTEFLKSNPDLINTSRTVKLVVTASIGHLEELLTRLIDGSMLNRGKYQPLFLFDWDPIIGSSRVRIKTPDLIFSRLVLICSARPTERANGQRWAGRWTSRWRSRDFSCAVVSTTCNYGNEQSRWVECVLKESTGRWPTQWHRVGLWMWPLVVVHSFVVLQPVGQLAATRHKCKLDHKWTRCVKISINSTTVVLPRWGSTSGCCCAGVWRKQTRCEVVSRASAILVFMDFALITQTGSYR